MSSEKKSTSWWIIRSAVSSLDKAQGQAESWSKDPMTLIAFENIREAVRKGEYNTAVGLTQRLIGFISEKEELSRDTYENMGTVIEELTRLNERQRRDELPDDVKEVEV